MADADGTAGQSIPVVLSGICTTLFPLQAGSVYYAASGGGLSTQGNRQVGLATRSNRLLVNIK